ncbi:MAG TPA: ABC-F family ATP-binding cassette domain-containing protein [Candidatus Thermoplasmatota archaeon]|nr:ABC-F family ATP-binding cassette domain-containing protein [Candidatus Thermoplasmatota archaeon]
MTRALVASDGFSVTYGPRRIFDNAAFQILEGERKALVGPNGSGKSTLIKMIVGQARPDTGEVVRDGNLRFSYLTQIFDFPPEATVGSLLTTKPAQVENLEAELAAIEARMADPAFYEEDGFEDVLSHYGELQREVQSLSSKMDASAALGFMQELGLGDVELDHKMSALSGGQKTRVMLAKALANHQEMDLLILDEPSNHLDIETVEWLEDFLTERYKGALLLVAHDQYLMDNIAQKILEIEGSKIWEWEGNFSAYKEQRLAYNRALEAKRKRDADEFKRQWQIIEEIKRRNRFDHQARSKAIRLEKAKKDMDLNKGDTRRAAFRLNIEASHKSSNDVMRISGLTKVFDNVPIFQKAEMTVGKGDKIGIIGPNGAGKTTLLRMIVGLEKPNFGSIEVSPGVKIGFFDQEHAGLDPKRTLIEEIRSIRPHPRMGEEEARGILGRFNFKGDDAFKTSAKLSGGEKARLALAKFLIGETNLLVLDEPTNHLDLESQEVVENALKEYNGSLLVVSHDRHFLDSVVNKIAVVHSGKIGVFPGNFSEARTLDELQRFMGMEVAEAYVVRKTFRDYEANKRYGIGETVKITGGETQTTKRLFKLAIERGWLEKVEKKE